MVNEQVLGFVGLGVMGGPMCANLIRRSGRDVIVHDTEPRAVQRMVELGATAAAALSELGDGADIVFLSLPSIAEVETVVDGLMAAARPPRLIVDMSTSDVVRTRALAERVAASGTTIVDAPVARRKEAAVAGTLLIMVGASPEVFDEVKELLSCMGSDILHVGSTGNGQIVKILNNMVLVMNMTAIAEALAIARASGVDGPVLFDALSHGSADSFALRKTATTTMLHDHFPEDAFPTDYAIKDMGLAIALADEVGVSTPSAEASKGLLQLSLIHI